MKRLSVLLALLALALAAIPAQAGDGSVRINFAPGASSATVSGHVTAGEPVRYVLRAFEGQTMDVWVYIMGEPPCLAVYGADGASLKRCQAPGLEWHGWLHRTQDYYVEVRGGKGQANYQLVVAISPLRATRGPMRIRFARGATSATVSGVLPAGTSDRYVLRALRGQSMSMHITAAGPVKVEVRGPGGKDWQWPFVEKHPRVPSLPATGDYTITLTAVETPTDYKMQVVIPPL